MDQFNGIKTKAVTGAVWKFLERMSAQVVSMFVAILLARMLEPNDYSIVSIVGVFFTFANIFISGGFNAALLQKKDADQEDYSSVLFLSLAVAGFLYVLLFASAPLIANLYEKPMLIAVIRIMGLILPVNALKSVVCAHISAHLHFRKFFFATLGGTIVSAIVGIVMAYSGFGAWALVAQQMTNTIIDTMILWLVTPMQLVFKISVTRLQDLFHYGWRIFVSSSIAALYTEVNPLFIGLKYSGTDLAFYSKGKSFPTLMSTICNSTLSAVLFPVLSKFQDNREELLSGTRRFIRTASFIVFPAMLGFYAVADDFVVLLLTEKWLPAVHYIRIFCIGELFASIHSGNCEAIKAMGRSDIFLKMELVKKSGYFIVIGLFMLFTNSPVALAYSTLGCSLIAVVVNCFPNIKILGYRVKYQLQDILPNLFSSICMCSIIIHLDFSSMPLLVALLSKITIGVVVYLGINLLIHNESLLYIGNYVSQEILRKKN